MDQMQLLRNSELFQNLLDDDLDYLLSRTENREYKPGDYVFKNQDTAECFYIIEAGEIIISQYDADGKVHDLARYISGDSFGEFEFVTNSPRDAVARANQACSLLTFPATNYSIDDMAREKPGSISRLYLQFLVILSKRLRSIHNLISENSVWVRQLQEGVFIDQHTGLYTRPFLDTQIPKALKLPAAIIIIKPDRFKEINDSYGHHAGDAVLHRIATNLLQLVEERKNCWAVRIRSNEMALILQYSSWQEAERIARNFAAVVAHIGPARVAENGDESASAQNFKEFRLTISIAMGMYEDIRQNWRDFFEATYELVKKAWSGGGNRMISLKTNRLEQSRLE